jgi:hypothetical protein
VRDVISKQSGIPLRSNNILAEKLEFVKFMNKDIDVLTYEN